MVTLYSSPSEPTISCMAPVLLGTVNRDGSLAELHEGRESQSVIYEKVGRGRSPGHSAFALVFIVTRLNWLALAHVDIRVDVGARHGDEW